MTQHNFVTNNFAELIKLVGNQTRKVANNTHIRYNEGLTCFEVVYHYSVVVRVWNDNSASFYSNGWQTPTTKERLNWFSCILGWKVYQEDYKWYIWNFKTNEELAFHEGMHISSEGEYLG